LLQDERSLAQRADLLRFQVNEIDAANLHDGEEDELREERHRLANVEKLMEQSNTVLMAMNGLDEEIPSIGDLLGKAEQAAEQVAALDPSMQTFLDRSYRGVNRIPIEARNRPDQTERG
jgi:DNA repair protein RecN (Recombination protein N)